MLDLQIHVATTQVVCVSFLGLQTPFDKQITKHSIATRYIGQQYWVGYIA